MNNILQQQLNSYWKIINYWNIILRKIWLFIKVINRFYWDFLPLYPFYLHMFLTRKALTSEACWWCLKMLPLYAALWDFGTEKMTLFVEKGCVRHLFILAEEEGRQTGRSSLKAKKLLKNDSEQLLRPTVNKYPWKINGLLQKHPSRLFTNLEFRAWEYTGN